MGPSMLGLEMPLHQQQQQHHHHPQMVAFAATGAHDSDHHQQSVKQTYPCNPRSKQQQLAISDDDEPVFAGDDGAADDKRKISPWQRMKWTDGMVRLLIMAVFYIGDEASSEGTELAAKKKSGGLLQKKGKWKSVSRAMMEKGFCVSPQQCEDKFNDLNKRYKRVNDILGKGTACKVVENQSLLDSMDNISPKMKEEVRKLLNSKHLFFREMCAYHNSCGGGANANSAGHHSPEAAQQQPPQPVRQRCFHSPENAVSIVPVSSRVETEGSKEEEDDDDEDEDDEDDDDEEDEEEVVEGDHLHHEEENGENDERICRKKAKKGGIFSQAIQQLSCEMMSVLQDEAKGYWEKKQWLATQLMKLEEHRVGYQCQAFELEKQRLKWVKFSGKKEREMERVKLDNERTRLENERMVLLVRQKELELLDLHQQQNSSNKRPDPSSVAG